MFRVISFGKARQKRCRIKPEETSLVRPPSAVRIYFVFKINNIVFFPPVNGGHVVVTQSPRPVLWKRFEQDFSSTGGVRRYPLQSVTAYSMGLKKNENAQDVIILSNVGGY